MNAPDGRPRLLVLASTFPAHHDDGTPAFVADLAVAQSDGVRDRRGHAARAGVACS